MVVLFKVSHVFIQKMLKKLFLSEDNTCSTGEEDGEKNFHIERTGTELMFIGSAIASDCL